MPSRALSSSYVSKKKNEYEVGRYLKNIVTDGAISFFIYAGFPLADIVVMTNIQFYGTKRVEFKGAFRGETRRSLRSGFGVYQYNNPFFRYEGTWQDGKKHGFGKLIFGDGSYYQGEFANNEIMGQGTRYFASSRNTYTGHFYYGEMDGQGRLRMGNGDCYEGDFKSNHFEGEGSYLSHDKQLYTGTWHNHRRHGHGEQTYADGSRYSGDWIADKRHGFGKLTDSQDTAIIYEGSWRNDSMHGEGSYYLGESYIYRNGMMVNNYPSKWPFKMSINEDQGSTLILTEEPTIITIDIVDSSEEINRVEADCGRSIRLRCGVKTDQPTSDSLPTPFGYHVNLVSRGTKSTAAEDRSASPTNAQTDANGKNESVEDSMLTASDNGQAQFVGIDINTFAILPKSAASAALPQSDARRDSNSSSQPPSTRTSRQKADKKTAPTFVLIIDDVTDPAPFNKSLDAVYFPVQLSTTTKRNSTE